MLQKRTLFGKLLILSLTPQKTELHLLRTLGDTKTSTRLRAQRGPVSRGFVFLRKLGIV